MRVLCVGDVVGRPGLAFALETIPALRRDKGIDLVIVNGENADDCGIGLPRAAAEQLLQVADAITTGNHCYHRANEALYTENETVLHPANIPFTEDGAGCCVIDTGRAGAVPGDGGPGGQGD